MKRLKEYICVDFPGHPVVKTLHFQSKGCRFGSWSRSPGPTFREAQPKEKETHLLDSSLMRSSLPKQLFWVSGNGRLWFNGNRASVWEDGRALELRRYDDCSTMITYFLQRIVLLKMVKIRHVSCAYFTAIF